MVGREQNDVYPERGTATDGVVLAVDGLSGKRVRGASFTARRGEVIGIGGLAGSGRSELMRLLAGAQKRSGGRVSVEGTPYSGRGVGKALAAGIALVPEERRSQGVILSSGIDAEHRRAESARRLPRWNRLLPAHPGTAPAPAWSSCR